MCGQHIQVPLRIRICIHIRICDLRHFNASVCASFEWLHNSVWKKYQHIYKVGVNVVIKKVQSRRIPKKVTKKRSNKYTFETMSMALHNAQGKPTIKYVISHNLLLYVDLRETRNWQQLNKATTYQTNIFERNRQLSKPLFGCLASTHNLKVSDLV